MVRKIVLDYSEKFVSKWFVFLIDLSIVNFCFLLSYILRFNLDVDLLPWENVLKQIPIISAIYTLMAVLSSSYVGIVRHTSFNDAIRVAIALITTSLIFGIITFSALNEYIPHLYFIPFSVIIIFYFTALFFQIFFRAIVKIGYYQIVKSPLKNKNVLIYGAGELGLITKNTLQNAQKFRFKAIGFIDDNPQKTGKTIDGIKIYSPEKVLNRKFLKHNRIRQIIIAMHEISSEKKNQIVDVCLEIGVQVKIVPTATKWMNGEMNINQFKDLRIEDLLERDSIKLDKKNIEDYIKGKKVLITGAAGSIGSEIVKQIIDFKPSLMILFDKDESGIYEVEFEFRKNNNTIPYKIVVGDICDEIQLNKVFSTYGVDVIFHAAAYKHVPLVENDPYAGVKVNIQGTKLLAEKAVEWAVQKFVMISTDKAVNPTNVMGATKRAAEIYTQSLNKIQDKTKFITTRFGNVLGSNGSVVPLFRRQIQEGGPITVTHPDITRYFMTIPEACQLVLEAGAMGNGGEIYVFDMGKPVRIADMAEKMIRLSGLEPQKDIQIVFSGLRPGEKLYEELLNNEENTMPTHFPKILIGKTREYDMAEIKLSFDEINSFLNTGDNRSLVKCLKTLIPEFKSQNSEYEDLD